MRLAGDALEYLVPEPDPRLQLCPACGASVVWMVTPMGVRLPLSVASIRVGTDGRRWAVSHVADCPQAGTWRTQRKRRGER